MSFEETMMNKVWDVAMGGATRFPGRFCCVLTCPNEAKYEIRGRHPEDITDACVGHVGELLGTPDWLAVENIEWYVRLIGEDELVTAQQEALGTSNRGRRAND